MKNVNGRMKHNKSNESKQTLNYIFNVDQKEVFDNELNNLKDDIERNNLTRLKIPAILNFISYKTNQINFHENLAESLKRKCNDRNIREYLVKENYLMTKNHMANHINNNNLNNLNFGKNKDQLLEYDDREKNSNFQNQVDNYFNFNSNIEDSPDLVDRKLHKQTLRKESSNNDNKFQNRSSNNFESKLNYSDGNVRVDNNEKVNEIVNINNITETRTEYQKCKVFYELKVFYLDGPENSAQYCKIGINEDSDYYLFIQQLKKQLGIYEYSKFKILLLNQSSSKIRVFLEEISQLKKNEINEIKIVPTF